MYVADHEYVMKLSNKMKVTFYLSYADDRKRVTAIARGCRDAGWYSCLRKLHNRPFRIAVEKDSRLDGMLAMADSYVGRATCHPKDTFDFQVGAKLAISRLKAKLDYAIAGREMVLRRALQQYLWSLELCHVDLSHLESLEQSKKAEVCVAPVKDNSSSFIDGAALEDEFDDVVDQGENICEDEDDASSESASDAVDSEPVIHSDMDGFNLNDEELDTGDAQPVPDEDEAPVVYDEEDVQISNAVAEVSAEALREIRVV